MPKEVEPNRNSNGPEGIRILPDLTARGAGLRPERRVLAREDPDREAPLTYASLHARVRSLAAALVEAGLEPGDRVALFLDNRADWLRIDLAIQEAALVGVPRGEDTAPAELETILAHSGAKAVFYKGPAPPCALPEDLLLAVDCGSGLAALEARGRDLLADPGTVETLDRRLATVQPEDTALLIYTSGTTGEPKGVMLTHRNLLSNLRQCLSVLDLREDDRFLSILPSWHAFERMLEYAILAAGGEIVYTDPRRLKADLAKVRPTVTAFVPRIWEMLAEGLEARFRNLPSWKRGAVDLCLTLGRRIGRRGRRGVLGIVHRVLSGLLLRPLHDALGGRLRLCISGGGSLPEEVDLFLVGCGVPLLNGYGLTETSPVLSVRLPEANRCGTVGPPLPGTEVRIRSKDGTPLPPGRTGEICVRGPQCMRGYFRNEEATRRVLDREGWFRTGDLGRIDEDGFLRISGRLKDTIVLSGGENVEPEPIEGVLRRSSWISQVCLVGQDRKQCGALIVPDLERAAMEGIDGETLRKKLRGEFDHLLSRERGFRPCDRIGPFLVLKEGFTIENGLLTQTLKLRRHRIHERYRSEIDGMFDR